MLKLKEFFYIVNDSWKVVFNENFYVLNLMHIHIWDSIIYSSEKYRLYKYITYDFLNTLNINYMLNVWFETLNIYIFNVFYYKRNYYEYFIL